MKRLVFLGTPEFARTVLESLWAARENAWDVVGVLTAPDKPTGRGQRVVFSPVKEFALEQGLPVQQPTTLRKPEPIAELAKLQPDVIVTAAYGLILPQSVLDLPQHGCLNVHASLLPRHRGAAPVAGAILAGDLITGTTIMLMDAGMDTGPILEQAELPIDAEETRGVLMDRLAQQGASLIVSVLSRWLAGSIAPQPQNHALATLTRPLTKEQGRIDWTLPASVVARQIRAYQPWPGAFTTWQGKLLKINAARLVDENSIAPGKVNRVGRSVLVGCGEGSLNLLEIQLEGRRSLDAWTFVNGQRDFVGSALE